MKAARVLPNTTTVTLEDVQEPVLKPGSAIVRIKAAFVSHFNAKIIDGSGGYLVPEKPFTPGMDAIGQVEAIAEGVRGLSVGDPVFCDCYYEPQQLTGTPERAFLGNFAFGAHSLPLLAAWPDGV